MISDDVVESPVTPPGIPPQLEAALRDALQPVYLLVRALGSGGMGTVWLARDPVLKRFVAVKVLGGDLAADPEARARFEREAQAVAGLSHPNVVGIYGVGSLPDGTPYFVMQYVAGRSLAARLESDGPFEPAEARRLVGDVASALAAAHAKGIIHRDIKPANVLYDDESRRALVSDFGIAAVQSHEPQDASAKLTQTGRAVGTPQYMSPEQIIAEAPTDRTDVYALGLVAYELVTGSPAFKGRTPQELMAAHLRDTPPRLADSHPHIDPEFETMVAQCLAKSPAARPRAADIAKRLTPGARVLLEWPPPGLEQLHGRVRVWTKQFWIASVLVLGPAFGFMVGGPHLSPRFGSPVAPLLILVALIGAGLAARALFDVLGSVRRAIDAGARGYSWPTLVETAADTRGDTGAVIAGTREYTALPPAVRGAVRRRRALAAASALAAAVAPLPLLVATTWLSGMTSFGLAFAIGVLTVPLGALLLAQRLAGRLERRAVRETRKALARRRAPRDVTARLVEPWYATVEEAGEGQGLQRGASAHAWVLRAVAVACSGAAVLAVFALMPIWFLMTAGPAIGDNLIPQLASIGARVRLANAARPYAVPPDSSITPLRGGDAMHSIVRHHYDPRIERRPQNARVDWPAYPAHLFADSVMWLDKTPDPIGILRIAKQGLTPAQDRYLGEIAAHPIWRDFGVVARAPRIDVATARYLLPFPPDYSPFSIPVPPFSGTKEVAYMNASRAAWHLAHGRTREAELAIRETISFGLKMIDDGDSLLDMLIGVVITGIGRGGLIELYTLTNNPAGARLLAAVEASQPDPSDLGRAVADIRADARATAIHMLTDSALTRGVRAAMLLDASVIACTNLRELLFGPTGGLRDAMQVAFRQLARSRADSALFELFSHATDREVVWELTRSGDGPTRVERILLQTGDLSSKLLGNARIGRCSRIATMARHDLNANRVE